MKTSYWQSLFTFCESNLRQQSAFKFYEKCLQEYSYLRDGHKSHPG